MAGSVQSVIFLTLFVLCGFLDIGSANWPVLHVNVNTNGSYSLAVDSATWLSSGHTVFNNGGKQYSTADGSLKLLNQSTFGGKDKFGNWTATSFTYQAGHLPVMTTIKVYTDPDMQVAVFTQKYLGDANQTSAGDPNRVISSFPSFRMWPLERELGFMAYGGIMVGYTYLEVKRATRESTLPHGLEGGPIVFFDNSSSAMVISPMSQFMAASNDAEFLDQISWGILGLVDNVPKDYSVDFVVYFSPRGINEAMSGWGDFLTKLYGKTSARRDNDLTLKYMGYWTDGGAYYYYNQEKGKNYEETMLDVDNYINNQSIPFKYLQFDSWWYLKGHSGGTKTWEPRKDVFPDGFKYISERTKLPFGCHNRYWDSDTTYAKYNGGKYNFIPDKLTGYSVPDDDQFWLDLFNMTQQWGQFILYEQDWLNDETKWNRVLQSDLFLGRRWLVGMGKGAEAYKTINIQYCMSYSRHILQSLEIPVVTQARASGDYHPSGDQWKIGKTSMFADALQIAPFKDTFWTTKDEPGNTYKKSEPNSRLNHVIATLSTGPVGPGDGIGYINKTLLMKCCDASGLILKPSKPATSIDDQIIMEVFWPEFYRGPLGEVYTTYTDVSGYFFGIVLAADVINNYDLTPDSGWSHVQLTDSLAYSTVDLTKQTPVAFSSETPLKLGPQCSIEYFCLYYTSPIIEMDDGVSAVLMGELDKWVPISPQRFTSVQKQTSDIQINLRVQAREKVIFTFYMVAKRSVQSIVCDNSQSSTAALNSVIRITKGTCTLAN